MIESSSKYNQIIKKAVGILIIIMPILCVAYFLWVRFRIPLVFYVENYRKLSYFGVFVLSTGYILTICLLMYANESNKPGIIKLGIVMFAITVPLCCLSNAISLALPRILDIAEISSTTYYLTGELEVLDSHAYSRLYECNNATYQCEQTIFFDGGGGAGFRSLHLMIDKSNNPDEINVIYTGYNGFEKLEFTYGAQPRYYDLPAQLGSHLYYLAQYRDSESKSKSATFVLYECKLDNTSCKQLPIKYEGFGNFRDTIADETTGDVSVFIDNEMNQDTLIFTWGEHPRCYVEGCKILDDIK